MKFNPRLGNFIDLVAVTSAITASQVSSFPFLYLYLGAVQLPLMFGSMVTSRVKWLPQIDGMSTLGKVIQERYATKMLDKSFNKALILLEKQGFKVTPDSQDLERLTAIILRQGLSFYEENRSIPQKWKSELKADSQFENHMMEQEKRKCLAVFAACDSALMDYGLPIKFAMLTQAQSSIFLPSDLITNFKLSDLETRYMRSMLISYECDLSSNVSSKDLIAKNISFENSKKETTPYRLKYMLKLVKNNFQYAGDSKTCILKRLEMDFDKEKNISAMPFKEYLSANMNTPAYALLMTYFDTISRYFTPRLYKSYIDYKHILEEQSDLEKTIFAQRAKSGVNSEEKGPAALTHKI